MWLRDSFQLEHALISKKLGQSKMFQILLYISSNLFDSTMEI